MAINQSNKYLFGDDRLVTRLNIHLTAVVDGAGPFSHSGKIHKQIEECNKDI